MMPKPPRNYWPYPTPMLLFTLFAGAFHPFLVVSSHAQITQEIQLSAAETEYLELFNRWRKLNQLPTVTIDPSLQSAARWHSEWMAMAGRLSHSQTRYRVPINDAPGRIRIKGFTGPIVAENIACGNDDPKLTFLQWVFSFDHLLALMNPSFEFIGIAKEESPYSSCAPYWAQTFGGKKIVPESIIGDRLPDLYKIARQVVGDPAFNTYIAYLKSIGRDPLNTPDHDPAPEPDSPESR